MLNLQKILEFARLINKFSKVERVVRKIGEDRWENDIEHSYRLAMLGWYIIDAHKLSLDKNLVLKYALLHDMVEVYAGDTFVFSQNQKEHESKKHREDEAAKKLEKNYPDFTDAHRLIKQYEAKNDKESRFVDAIDKLDPMISIFLDNGRTWKEKNITIDMIIEYKKEKVAVSPEIEACFYEFIDLLKEKEKEMF
ncbi:MAG: HD domain-containing protein [bacterium]|nr:HD domain-containing protein [bacterium]